jgi:cyanuric acid amidohydrolase
MMSLSQLINGHTGESAQSVYGRVPFIFSRGVEVVLSPHYAVFTVSPDKGGPDKGSVIAEKSDAGAAGTRLAVRGIGS